MPRDAQEPGLAVAGPVLAAGCGASPCVLWLHASCVELAGSGIVLIGPSGSGKSDLALRLIDGGARLIADDQLAVERQGDRLLGRPPAALAGLLEVRGFGIVRLPWHAVCPLGLAVGLDPATPAPRLPEAETHELLGVRLPYLRLDPRAPSACAKIRLALTAERCA
jgi:serine kinase of HPr protein (carbohydrate metabolism regulator)